LLLGAVLTLKRADHATRVPYWIYAILWRPIRGGGFSDSLNRVPLQFFCTALFNLNTAIPIRLASDFLTWLSPKCHGLWSRIQSPSVLALQTLTGPIRQPSNLITPPRRFERRSRPGHAPHHSRDDSLYSCPQLPEDYSNPKVDMKPVVRVKPLWCQQKTKSRFIFRRGHDRQTCWRRSSAWRRLVVLGRTIHGQSAHCFGWVRHNRQQN
jgi:hypothetical protein